MSDVFTVYIESKLSENVFTCPPLTRHLHVCWTAARPSRLRFFLGKKQLKCVQSKERECICCFFQKLCFIFFFISGQATLFLIVIAVVPKLTGGLWACWPTGDSCSYLCLSRESSQMVFCSSLIVLFLTLLFLATGFDGSVLVLLRNPVSHKTPTDLSKKKNIRVVCVYVCPCSSVEPFWSIPVILPWLCFDFPFSSVNSLQF